MIVFPWFTESLYCSYPYNGKSEGCMDNKVSAKSAKLVPLKSCHTYMPYNTMRTLVYTQGYR